MFRKVLTMRHVALITVLSGLLLLSGPLVACENDRDTAPYEREYQEQYEPQSYAPLAAAAVEIDAPYLPNLYAVAGMGFGAAMLIAGVAIPTLLWRYRK